MITVLELLSAAALAADVLAAANASRHAAPTSATIAQNLLITILKLMEQANERVARQFRDTARAHAP